MSRSGYSAKILIFFIIVLLTFNSQFICNAENLYGEDSESLDQLVDDFENENYVSVKDDVSRNSTINCMELNYTSGIEVSNNTLYFREQDRSDPAEPVFTFNGDYGGHSFRMDSTTTSYGQGYLWLNIDADWVNEKYVRYRFQQGGSWPGKYPCNFRMYNGSTDPVTDFEDPGTTIKGSGGISLNFTSVYNTWIIVDVQIDSSACPDEELTLAWRMADGYTAQSFWYYIDWIEINEGSGGSGNIQTIDFDSDTDEIYVLSGSDKDWGYVNNTGLPVETGGYEDSGYFTTENYMSELNGSCLVFLVNSSIPDTLDLKVQFSIDNSTWLDNENSSGYNSLSGGLEAFDLRQIYSDVLYLRFNFTGTKYLTPRLFQSRIISSSGSCVSSEDYSLIVIGLMVGLLFGFAISFKRD